MHAYIEFLYCTNTFITRSNTLIVKTYPFYKRNYYFLKKPLSRKKLFKVKYTPQ